MTKSSVRQSEHMRHFSTLAGPIKPTTARQRQNFKVSFIPVDHADSRFFRSWARIVAVGSAVLTLILAGILFYPEHWIIRIKPEADTTIFSLIMLVCLALLQIFMIVGNLSATRGTLKAKDPVPVSAPRGLKIAFVTTRAPGEPVTMVETTLQAIKRLRRVKCRVDGWLLDETGDPELKRLCDELKINYFSRNGIAEWNTPKPVRWLRLNRLMARLRRQPLDQLIQPNQFFAARSKHGNFNSWLAYLEKINVEYDLLAGVDTDHIPEPNYLERMIGYFRDDNVAYVVGPQVYGNYGPGLSGLVARWAESQASFFQSTIQRAGNSSMSAMFVGTNYVVRLAALRQAGGFQPCITEDMATGIAIHARINPQTGQKWRSVYTPDVLAVGEGPDFWGPYFTQQWRWAAGAFDTWRRMVWRVIFKLPFRSAVHYFFMLCYYPITAMMWLLSIVSSLIYLITGATAIQAPWGEFVSLYAMTVVMQLSLYFWNRRYNVSPHEPQGSYGVAGMAISTITAPIYLSALAGIVFGKKPHFVVTTKGDTKNPDWIKTFKIHLLWAGLLLGGLVYGFTHGNSHPAMLLWVFAQLLICFTPFVLGMTLAIRARRRQNADNKTKLSLTVGEISNV